MIKFIRDYTTKALPPEVFEKDQEVERSIESERYLVQLGVAGYLVDGVLVDQDYRPIVVETVVVVSAGDRRFADAGRGGEVIGIDAPRRASTGPGNAAMFGGTDVFETVDGELHRVQFEQLSADLAASVQQLDEHRTTTATRMEQLTGDLTTAQGARETALADLATAQSERDQARGDLQVAGEQKDALAAKVQELEAKLAEPPAARAPGKPARGK